MWAICSQDVSSPCIGFFKMVIGERQNIWNYILWRRAVQQVLQVQKLQGMSPTGQWVYHPGKGRGRGRGDWFGDGKGDGKNDHKGKGKKGKGRGGKWKGHDAYATEWEKNKDKAEEKK